MQIRSYPDGSPDQTKYLSYYSLWLNHVNSPAIDRDFDKIDALNLALAQYPAESEAQKSLLLAFYNWYMQLDDSDGEKGWRDILINSLPPFQNNQDAYVQSIFRFHAMYFQAAMSTRGGDDEDDDGEDDDDSGSGDYDENQRAGGPNIKAHHLTSQKKS